jgi:hypothetical protein
MPRSQVYSLTTPGSSHTLPFSHPQFYPKKTTVLIFFSPIIVFLVLALHIKEIIQNDLFCARFLSVSIFQKNHPTCCISEVDSSLLLSSVLF